MFAEGSVTNILGVFFRVVTLCWEVIDEVVGDVSLVVLVDIFTGTSDIISGVAVDVVIIVEIYNVVSVVDVSNAEEDGVCGAEKLRESKQNIKRSQPKYSEVVS